MLKLVLHTSNNVLGIVEFAYVEGVTGCSLTISNSLKHASVNCTAEFAICKAENFGLQVPKSDVIEICISKHCVHFFGWFQTWKHTSYFARFSSKLNHAQRCYVWFLRMEFFKFIQMMCHHQRNLGIKFQLNRSNRLEMCRDYIYYNCIILECKLNYGYHN